MIIFRKLQNAIEEDGMAAKDLSETADVFPATVASLRRGKADDVLLSTAEKLVPVLFPGHSLKIVKDEANG